MAKIVGLPKLSPTMEEGTLARWVKKKGDEIAVDDLVAEIETDKATMEWRALDAGVLLEVLVPEGTTLAPDTPVAIVGKRGEDISALLAELRAPSPSTAPASTAPASTAPASTAPASTAPASTAPASTAPASTAPASTAPASTAPASTAPASSSPDAATSGAATSGRVLASPLVRRIAREQGLDLRTIRGSGPKGRVIKRDLAALERNVAAPWSAAPSVGVAAPSFVPDSSSSWERRPPRRQPLSQMRKTIARRLTESKQNVPHFYLTIDVDAEPLLDARAALNKAFEREGAKVSINDLIVKACAVALRRVPECNASFADNEALYHEVVDVSVAVAVPDGLVTPVVRDADRKGVLAISAEIKDLAARAREKKLKPEQMQGGTFSVSNLGMFGIDEFAAVINPPEGAILAVGAVRDEAVVKDGAVAPGKRMRMTLSCDHRIIDGAVGARYLAMLKSLLEAPITLIA